MSTVFARRNGQARGTAAKTSAVTAAEREIDELLEPTKQSRKFPLAIGHATTRTFPSQPSKLKTKYEQIINSPLAASDNDYAAAEKLHVEIQESIAALLALDHALSRSNDLAELHEQILKDSRDACTLHRVTTGSMLSQVRELEVMEREFLTFMVCAQLRPRDRDAILSRISVVPLDTRELIAHPQFGKTGYFPPYKEEGRKTELHSVLVGGGTVVTVGELKKLGTIVRESAAYVLASLAADADVDDFRDAGVENVWLHQVEFVSRPADPIYETPGDDVFIQGAWKSAGDRVHVGHVSPTYEQGTFTTGCRQGFPFSKDYAYMPEGYPIFRDDYTHKQSAMVIDRCVGNTEEDPYLKVLRGYLVGGNLFETWLASSSIPVVETLNSILIDVLIEGKTLLVPSPKRERMLEELQRRLQEKYVGEEPKVLSSLNLRIDTTSDDGLRALSLGGFEVKVEYKIKNFSSSVHFSILPGQGPPPPAPGSGKGG